MMAASATNANTTAWTNSSYGQHVIIHLRWKVLRLWSDWVYTYYACAWVGDGVDFGVINKHIIGLNSVSQIVTFEVERWSFWNRGLIPSSVVLCQTLHSCHDPGHLRVHPKIVHCLTSSAFLFHRLLIENPMLRYSSSFLVEVCIL
jgi:hypothetical protein